MRNHCQRNGCGISAKEKDKLDEAAGASFVSSPKAITNFLSRKQTKISFDEAFPSSPSIAKLLLMSMMLMVFIMNGGKEYSCGGFQSSPFGKIESTKADDEWSSKVCILTNGEASLKQMKKQRKIPSRISPLLASSFGSEVLKVRMLCLIPPSWMLRIFYY